MAIVVEHGKCIGSPWIIHFKMIKIVNFRDWEREWRRPILGVFQLLRKNSGPVRLDDLSVDKSQPEKP